MDTRLEVRRVLTLTLILNLLVAFGKIITGTLTGALAITADGFHSLVDGMANIVALIASHIATQPPDEQHPYGHRRFETLAALMIGVFLVLVAWEIAGSALRRLSGGDLPELTPLAFIVMIGTLCINIGVSTYERRVGRRLNSELLLADAANTSTDVFVTLSVLVSMALVELTGWAWLDVAAALIVVVLIGHAAWKIFKQTGSVLVDTAPYTPAQLEDALEGVPFVRHVIRARSRGPADAAFVDVDVQVAPEMTADQTAAIGDTIRSRLENSLGGIAEVDVHFTPDFEGEREYPLVVRAAGDALGLATHEVALIDAEEKRILEMHVEVPPGQTLAQAHDMVSLLERNLSDQLPEVDEIITHIEPALSESSHSQDAQDTGLVRVVMSLLKEHYPRVDWHDVNVYDRDGATTLTLHAALLPELSVERAHAIAEGAETLLRAEIPILQRVTIHTEPYDH